MTQIDWASFRRPTPPCSISCQLRHRRLEQAHPYTRPGIWPTLADALRDVALALAACIGLILALAWMWTR